MKAAIYIRVSTGDQTNSIEMQERRCRAYCEMNNYEIVDVFIDEDVSGSTNLFERPLGSELYKAIKKKEVDHIVCLKLDRAFRSAVDGIMSIDDLTKKNIFISFVDMGGQSFNSASPASKLTLTMLTAIAEWERGMISERTKSVLRDKKLNLKVYSGTTPFGFKRKGLDLVVNEKEMNIVRSIYNMRQEGHTFRRIGKELKIDHTKAYRIYHNDLYRDFTNPGVSS